MYTTEEVDAVVEAWVLKKGNNAISGALQPVKQRFVTAYNAAVMTGDKTRQDELDTFRKDVGTYVRLHDFLSQIINFEDTTVEKRAHFCRLLSSQLRAGAGRPEAVDLTDVDLVHIKQKDLGTQKLTLSESENLPPGFKGAGSKTTRDPKMVLLDELIDRLNEQFAGEDFREDQERSWINALIDAMKTDDDLRLQAEANNQAQFLASPTLRDSLLLAVNETNDAHGRMTQLFNEKGTIEKTVLAQLGKVLYLEMHPPDDSV